MKSELSKSLILKYSQKCPFLATCKNNGIDNSASKFKYLLKYCPYMSQKTNIPDKVNYDEIFDTKIEEKKQNNTYRVFNRIGRLAQDFTKAECYRVDSDIKDGENKLVSVWCSNDYLGMSRHPEVVHACLEAVRKYGVGSGGTRNISGNNLLHERLEAKLADWYNKEAGLLFTSCYVANSTTLTTLGKLLKNCVILSDQGNHASMIEGIRYSGCPKIIYEHNNLEDLETKLSNLDLNAPKIVAFESVNSMNGSVAPVTEICRIAKKYGALTFIDEVHAVGLYGTRGSGLSEHLGCLSEVDIISGTLGKAVGSVGGFIVGKSNLVDMIRSYAPGLIFTTSLPPAVVSASIKSIEILQSQEGQELRIKHQHVVSNVRKCITQLGIPILPSPSHIIPVFVGDSSLCRSIGKYMLDVYNVYVQPINYPTVKFGTERLRIAPTPGHSSESLIQLINALSDAWNMAGLQKRHPRCDNNACDCKYTCSTYKDKIKEPTINYI